MRIKWVALAADGFYVSNFFRTAKYSYDSLKSIEETKILLYKRISFVLRDKGSFGEKIFFIAGYQWEYYLQKNPEIMQAIFNATSTPNLNPNDPKSLPK